MFVIYKYIIADVSLLFNKYYNINTEKQSYERLN